MYVYYKFGLLLIFLLCLSHNFTRAAPPSNAKSTQSSSYDDYGEDYDDYYDDNSGNVSTTTTSTSNSYVLQTTEKSNELDRELKDRVNNSENKELDLPKRSNHVVEPICPKNCICTDEYRNIECSNRQLTHVPKDIPPTAMKIDLSQNKITRIQPDDFVNCSKVEEINLSGNDIGTIETEAFTANRRLHRLSLANNKLTTIDPDAFTLAKELSELDLSNNAILLPVNGSFLNQPDLLELSCQNCSWLMLYDESFANLSSLTSLKLDGNDFSKKINTKAFEPMKNLIKLKLPELEQQSIQELCNVLKSIDNISLKRFDISCFELVLGTSFNDSLIFATDPPFVPPPHLSETGSKTNQQRDQLVDNFKEESSSSEQHSPAVKKKATVVMTHSAAAAAVDDSSSASSNLTLPNRNAGNISFTDSGTSDDAILLAGFNGTTDTSTEKTYKVDVSQEFIKYMLISIMVLAVIGLVIGFICRKDFGGIKTKCCRTRKPAPTDQVRPAEEIPLNKIA